MRNVLQYEFCEMGSTLAMNVPAVCLNDD